MSAVRMVARPLLGGIFLRGGVDTFQHPDSRVAMADTVLERMRSVAPLPVDDVTLVRANAAVQVASGGLLALGLRPRLAAAVLAASLVPTTLGGHRFWEHDDPVSRAHQRNHFLKNAAILGGLLLAAEAS
jgi:putative oxidoreductase